MQELDVLRGLCIVAMLSSHVAPGGIADRVLHVAHYADGATGFVFISGLVLGITRRARASTTVGARATRRWLVRRSAQLYGIQFVLVLLTLALASYTGGVAPGEPRAWLDLLGRTLLMRERPNFVDILPLYVLFLLLAVPAIEALRRGRGSWVVGVSFAAWAFTQAFADAPGLVLTGGRGYQFRWTAWQFLFVGGLCLGWHRDELLPYLTRPRVRRLLVAATVVACGLLVLASAGGLGAPGLAERLRLDVAGGVAAKPSLGPVVIIDFAALFVLGVAVTHALLRRTWAVVPLGWLQVIGRRSLRSYVAITVIAILVVAAPSDLQLAVRDALALLALVLVYAIARVELRGGRSAAGSDQRL